VRYSLRVLEEEQLIEPTSQGATTTDQAREFVAELDDKVENISEKLEDMKIDEGLEIGH
jgi:predicted transcriptional regulator